MEEKKRDWTYNQYNTSKKGFTKENTKKLFGWGGWKKEIGWIVIFLMFMLLIYAYYSETKSCVEMQKTECFNYCIFDQAVEQLQFANPGVTILCDRETLMCIMSGVQGIVPVVPSEIGGLTINFTE